MHDLHASIDLGNTNHYGTHVSETSLDHSILSDTSVTTDDGTRKPLHASTPVRKQKEKKPQTPLRVLNINFQSIKQKRCRLENVIECVKRDIIIGTETWLHPEIKTSEINPTDHTIYRKDRTTSGGGGVMNRREINL